MKKLTPPEIIVTLLNYTRLTIKTQRKPTYFSRWMNLVNNFV